MRHGSLRGVKIAVAALAAGAMMMPLTACGGDAVSYTHLDVYKRQSFYRAHEVIDSARVHDFGYAYTDDGITLTALVDSADGYADDYSVTAHVDQGIGDLTASHCTCPAYGRFGAICKHVIALIMAYDEDPDAFEALDEDGGDPSPAARPRPRRSPRTSRRLQAFMREREQSRQSDVQSRQLTLLKEIDAMSSSGGSTGAQQGGAVSRHLPIGSVVLRPELRRFGTSWAVRLLSLIHISWARC